MLVSNRLSWNSIVLVKFTLRAMRTKFLVIQTGRPLIITAVAMVMAFSRPFQVRRSIYLTGCP